MAFYPSFERVKYKQLLGRGLKALPEILELTTESKMSRVVGMKYPKPSEEVGFLKVLDHKQAASGNTKGINKLSQTIDWEWPLGTQGDSGLRLRCDQS
mgnify:CR=1 FL=1